MTTTTANDARALFARHRALLDGALETIRTRGYWTAFVETPSAKAYGEGAADAGQAAFEARLGRPFELDQAGTDGRVGAERSPYGIALDVTYPRAALPVLLPAMRAATRAWTEAGVEARVGVALEILVRLNAASYELAHATMHTTGQPFLMAFQAGGPESQNRGLEAVAYAYEAMRAVPERALWEKPQGKHDPLRIEKRFRIVGRGVAAVVASSTFPLWNSYPGLFASLVTGNAVVVKPHPAAILPLAITVAICRDVLREAGFPPDLVALAADEPSAPITRELVVRPEIGIIDYTGSTAFGTWIEEHARQAIVFTEKAGVNTVVIDGTRDWKGLTRNLALSLALYSGQMCTTPQDIFVPRDGIETDQGHLGFDEVAAGIAAAVDALLAAPERAVEIVGALATEATLARVERLAGDEGIVLAPRALAHPRYPGARIRTPLIAKLDAGRRDVYGEELFGPIAFVVATASTDESLELAAELARERGAITAVVHTTSDAVRARAEELALEAGVSLAFDLTGGLLVNQSVAFSDFHVTGANPAGNASLTDAAFVATRFRVIQTRTPVVG